MVQSNPASSECDFSYEWYEKMLRGLEDFGYTYSSFTEYPEEGTKKVYLRHDIDISLEKTSTLAEIENNFGIQATYFIRLSNPFYNPFDKKMLPIILKLSSLGHHLALHFDWMKKPGEYHEKELTKAIETQLAALKTYFPVQNVVSFHKPDLEVMGKTLANENIISTYDPRFFDSAQDSGKKWILYLSDSGGRWGKHGTPLDWISSQKPLHILTHPIWWWHKRATPKEKLRYWHSEKSEYFKKYWREDFEKVYL